MVDGISGNRCRCFGLAVVLPDVSSAAIHRRDRPAILLVADGSGLSRNNRMTTDDMQQVLRYIWQHDKELNLIASLPISGESGTLKYRKSMRSSPIKGQIQAKSGSVYGSYNMAGYILDQQHNPTAMFVQFVADYHPVKKDSDKKGESPNVLAPIYQFEQQFYADAIKLGQESDSPH